jgi:hypothetical protein
MEKTLSGITFNPLDMMVDPALHLAATLHNQRTKGMTTKS